MGATLKNFDYAGIDKALSKLSLSLSDMCSLSPKDALVRASLMDPSEELSNPPAALTRALMYGVNSISTDWDNPRAWWSLWAMGQINPEQQGRELSVLANMITQRPLDDQALTIYARMGAVCGLEALDDFLNALRPSRIKKVTFFNNDPEEDEDEGKQIFSRPSRALTAEQHVQISTVCVRAAFAALVSPATTDWRHIDDDTFIKGVRQYVANCKTKNKNKFKSPTCLGLIKYCNPSVLGEPDGYSWAGGPAAAHTQLVLGLENDHRSDDQVVQYLRFHSHDLAQAALHVADLIVSSPSPTNAPASKINKIDAALRALEAVLGPKKCLKLSDKFLVHLASNPQFTQTGDLIVMLMSTHREGYMPIIQKLASLAKPDDFQQCLNTMMADGDLGRMEQLYEVIPSTHNRQGMLLSAVQHLLRPHKQMAADMQKVALTIALLPQPPIDQAAPKSRKKM